LALPPRVLGARRRDPRPGVRGKGEVLRAEPGLPLARLLDELLQRGQRQGAVRALVVAELDYRDGPLTVERTGARLQAHAASGIERGVILLDELDDWRGRVSFAGELLDQRGHPHGVWIRLASGEA